MASSTLHFSVGMLLGSLFTIPAVVHAWHQKGPVAYPLVKWCLLSILFGIYAVIPAIVRRIGDSPETGSHAVWNLFIFYPVIERLHLPGILAGELICIAIFSLQYATILLAILRARKHPFRQLSSEELDI